jgi:hypothetical protein
MLTEGQDDYQLEAVHLIDDQTYYHVAYHIATTDNFTENLGIFTPQTIHNLSWSEEELFPSRGLAKSKGTGKVASRHYYTGLSSQRIDIVEESPSGWDHRILYNSGPGFPITDRYSAEDAQRLVTDIDKLEDYELIKPVGIGPKLRFLAKQTLKI